jgi:hypothetical protein
MRHIVRPFITEYKNRTPKYQTITEPAAREPAFTCKDAPSIDVRAIEPSETRRDDEYRAALEAADAIFTAKPLETVALTTAAVARAGRILPCVTEEADVAVASTNKPPKIMRRARAVNNSQRELSAEAAKAPPRRAPEIAAAPIVRPAAQSLSAASVDGKIRRENRVIQRRWVRKTELKPGEKWKRRLHKAVR